MRAQCAPPCIVGTHVRPRGTLKHHKRRLPLQIRLDQPFINLQGHERLKRNSGRRTRHDYAGLAAAGANALSAARICDLSQAGTVQGTRFSTRPINRFSNETAPDMENV